MSLSTPLVFILVYILLIAVSKDMFSLLLFTVMAGYITAFTSVFFDNIPADNMAWFRLMWGSITLIAMAKTIWTSRKTKNSIGGEKQ